MNKFSKRLLTGLISGLSLMLFAGIGANAEGTQPNSSNSANDSQVQIDQQNEKKPKKVVSYENLNGTTTSVPNKYIVHNRNYDFYYNMTPIYNVERTIRGNSKVTFKHPMYFHYARLTHYKSGRPFGDPQSMSILPDGRMYILYNVGHGNSLYNRILEYSLKKRNRKLLKIGDIFKGGHGQGLNYDYYTHKLLLCMNQFISHHHGLLKGDLLISHVGKQTLKPYGKIDHIKAPKNMNLGDDFTSDAKGNYYNVSKYGRDEPFAPYGGLSIYRGNQSKMKLVKLLFTAPDSTVQNIEYNPATNRVYIVGNNCITSFPVNKLNHLKNRNMRVSIFNNPVEFESYRDRAYLLLPRPSRILVSDQVF